MVVVPNSVLILESRYCSTPRGRSGPRLGAYHWPMTDLASDARPASAIHHKPTGPRGLPLLGHLLDIRRDVLGFFTQCSQDYGDVVALRFAGWPTLLINNPDHIEKVLVKEHRNFVKHKLFWRHVTALFGNGLLTSEGDFWHRQRRLSAPAFSGQRLTGYGATMVQHTSRLLDTWRVGEIRDLHADMM